MFTVVSWEAEQPLIFLNIFYFSGFLNFLKWVHMHYF